MTMAAQLPKDLFEALPDHYKSEYVEKDGVYLLDVQPTGGFALENVEGLKTSLSAARTERDTAVQTANAFKGVDVTAAKDAIEKVKQYANFNPDEKVAEGIKAQKEQLIAEHMKVVGEKEAIVEKLTRQVEKQLVDSTATTALGAHKGNITLLLPHIKNQVKMTEVNGEYVAQILDGAGNARIGNTKGDLMTVDQLVTEMKGNPEFSSAFEGTGSVGTGGKPGGSTDAQNPTPKTPVTTVQASDQNALDDNLEKIASGEVVVDFEQV